MFVTFGITPSWLTLGGQGLFWESSKMGCKIECLHCVQVRYGAFEPGGVWILGKREPWQIRMESWKARLSERTGAQLARGGYYGVQAPIAPLMLHV